jgi:amino acid transporter
VDVNVEKADRRGERTIGFWATFAIGVGGMVGGGIFAVLGLAVQYAKGGTPIAFALAGTVALTTAYSYARLSVRFPSQGGTVEFINRAFGSGWLTGGVNVLLWISYAVMLALYAHAFGSYAASFLSDPFGLWRHLFTSGVVILLTVLNLFGAGVVGRAEEWIVGVKLSILLFFVAAGLGAIQPGRLSVGSWAAPLPLVAGGMMIFLAYEGFELIANAAADVRRPERTIPRALFASVLFVVVLYVAVAAVAVGALPVAQIVEAKDYALAIAARPFLGAAGFALIAVAAMLSTGSAINATLYGASRITYILAKEGELPAGLERKIWHRPVEGLLVTSAVTLALANMLDISKISMIGSAGFLLVFVIVNLANVRLHRGTRGWVWLSQVGAALSFVALLILVEQSGRANPWNLAVLGGLVGAAFAIEVLYRRFSTRRGGREVLASTARSAEKR